VGEHPVASDAECGHDPVQVRLLEISSTAGCRCSEGEDAIAPAHLDESSSALLHDAGIIARSAAGLEPRVRRTERGMPGEGQLPAGSEDPQAVVGLGVGRRQYERRLRQVRPSGDALHRLAVQPVAVEDDGDGVAQVGDR